MGHGISPEDRLICVSGGSIAGALATCKVDIHTCLDAAPQNVTSIGGVYRSLQTWLNTTLPTDAHVRCSGRLVIVSRDLLGRVRYTSQYTSRQALVQAILTSCNLPIYAGFWRCAWSDGIDGISIPRAWRNIEGIVVDPLRKYAHARWWKAIMVPSLAEATRWAADGLHAAETAGPATSVHSPKELHDRVDVTLATGGGAHVTSPVVALLAGLAGFAGTRALQATAGRQANVVMYGTLSLYALVSGLLPGRGPCKPLPAAKPT